MKSWTVVACLWLATGVESHHPKVDYSDREELLPGVREPENNTAIIKKYAWEALQHLEQATNYIYARAFAEDQVSPTIRV